MEYAPIRAEHLYELGRVKPDHLAALRLKSRMEALEQVEDIGVRFVGAVLNNVSFDKRSSYYSYYG